MGRENSIGLMVRNMLATIRMERRMDKEYIRYLMARNMRATGPTGRKMDREYVSNLMVER